MYNTHEEVDRLVAGLTRIHPLIGITVRFMAALPDKKIAAASFYALR